MEEFETSTTPGDFEMAPDDVSLSPAAEHMIVREWKRLLVQWRGRGPVTKGVACTPRRRMLLVLNDWDDV